MSPVRGMKNQHWKIQPDSTYADKYLIAHQLVLISDTPPPENTVFCNIATYPFPPTGQGTLHTGYYVPTLKTQATFDAFFYDTDKNQAMVLQVTVSPWPEPLVLQFCLHVTDSITGFSKCFRLFFPNTVLIDMCNYIKQQ